MCRIIVMIKKRHLMIPSSSGSGLPLHGSTPVPIWNWLVARTITYDQSKSRPFKIRVMSLLLSCGKSKNIQQLMIILSTYLTAQRLDRKMYEKLVLATVRFGLGIDPEPAWKRSNPESKPDSTLSRWFQP